MTKSSTLSRQHVQQGRKHGNFFNLTLWNTPGITLSGKGQKDFPVGSKKGGPLSHPVHHVVEAPARANRQKQLFKGILIQNKVK